MRIHPSRHDHVVNDNVLGRLTGHKSRSDDRSHPQGFLDNRIQIWQHLELVVSGHRVPIGNRSVELFKKLVEFVVIVEEQIQGKVYCIGNRFSAAEPVDNKY